MNQEVRQNVVLGMGTGRCGTHTLARLLNQQPDAHVTHEQPPLLPWDRFSGRSGFRERLARWKRTRPQRLIGDVALFYLPYVEEAVSLEPAIRVVCLERPREEVVASFMKWVDTVHPLPTDHWAVVPPPGWYHDPVWTRIFPQYKEPESRAERIGRYWDEYHERAVGLSRRYPENVRIFATEALNTEEGVREVLAFAGIPADRQAVLTGLRVAATEKVGTHPRRAVLADAGRDDPRRCAVLVAYGSHISPACEAGLRELERRGYPVRRLGGSGTAEVRDRLATDALCQGFEETMWIAPDLSFDPALVDRFRSYNLPVVCGLCPQPGQRRPAFPPPRGATPARPGEAGGLAEVPYATTGFMLVRYHVYTDIIQRLGVPLCNEHLGRPLVPFFRPTIRPLDEGAWYLPPDFAFCEAVRRSGHRVVADMSVKLRRVGMVEYGWEEG